MASLQQSFSLLLPLIEDDLQAVLTPPENSPPLFYRMLHYHMGWVDHNGESAEVHGGKRIRPVMCLLVCEAVSENVAPARPAAAAVELIHNFSLLHDDIQDRSPTRRGRPTVWAIWGEAQAINAGDALFALAHLAIPRLVQPDNDKRIDARMLEILGKVCLELTRGQHLDISFEQQEKVSVEAYLEMVGAKTAALLGGAAHLGALAGGADKRQQSHYAAFGRNLGMAFQVKDDILDIWGDPSVTGKQSAVDIRQRKKTLPVLYGLERSAALNDLYRSPDPFDDAAVAEAVKLLDEVGAREYAQQRAQEYSEHTLRYLEEANLHKAAGHALLGLVEMLIERDR